MLNPIYIQSILEQNGFFVEYINGANTGGIHIHRFSVQGENTKKELVVVKYIKLFGNKVFIETEHGTNILGGELTKKLEETIGLAIAMTPDNRLPHLLNPICFSSINFPELTEFHIDEEYIEEDFKKALQPMNKRNDEDTLCFLTYSFPNNKHASLITSLFAEIDSVHEITANDSNTYVKFHSFTDSTTKEFSVFHEVQKGLSDIGVYVEICDID
jgi:hypothetical protein